MSNEFTCYHVDHIHLQLPLNWDKFNMLLRNSSFFIYCTQTECSCTPCPKMYTPWLLSVSCCNLSAILLINPLNTVRLSTQSSTIIHTVMLSRRTRILVVSATYRRLHKNSLNARLFLSPCPFSYSTRLDFWSMCVAACIVTSWSN